MTIDMHSEIRPPIHLAIIDRENVRRMVEEDSEYLKWAAAYKKNIHQVGLDRQDQVNAYMAGLSSTDLDKFIKLYEEEMRASTQAVLDNIAAINAGASAKLMQNATQASQVATWISLIMFFVVLISAISIFKNL